MKILKVLLYIAGAIAVLVVAVGLFARHDYHIERSMDIDAPREVVLEQIRKFENFKKWSPWASLDPQMQQSIEGTDGEVGAVYRWSGNDEVGAGSQTLKSATDQRVEYSVVFEKPWKSSAPSYFNLESQGEKTRVSWAFDMYVGFPWNGMAMLTDINAMVGKDYERGLTNLKKICEAIVHPTYNGFEVVEKDMPATWYVSARQEVKFEDISGYYVAHIPKIMEQIRKSGLQMSGAPSSLFWVYDEQAGKTDMAAAVPIGVDKKLEGFETFHLGGSKALVIDYHGPYDSTGKAHMGMDLYMAQKGLKYVPPVIEQYVTDPTQEPDTSKWLTRVVYFVVPDSSKTAPQPKK
jgi:effector-binding domain-containing protein